ncbi:hypothetical protein JCM5353_000337 [Sporobolomyces roseus]
MSRPLSPSSHQSPPTSSISSPKRIVRSLLVEAHATHSGIHSKLYCKVNLSEDSSSLLRLLPTSRLVSHTVYLLPLDPGGDLTEETRRAALLLGISIDEHRSNQSTHRGQCEHKNVEVMQEGEELVLKRESRDGEYPSEEGSNSFERSRVRGMGERDGSVSPEDTRGKDTIEAIVIVELETSFAGIREPKFANTITLPTPPCLRNLLHLTLPPSPSPSLSTGSWDLKVAPSLSNVQSCPISSTSNSSPSTLLTGSFPSTSSLLIRWNRQIPQDSPPPLLVIPRTSLGVQWSINELGWGRAEVQVKSSFEYAGLKDKHWIEFEVGLGEDDEELSKSVFEVLMVEGVGVLGWELERRNQQEESRGEVDEFSSPLEDSIVSSIQGNQSSTSQPQTPTPRRRYSRSIEPRPPSWTSLFDTAPPAPPDLDSSLIVTSEEMPSRAGGRSREKEKEPSLLRIRAPFDEEGSGMDMSFENVDSEIEGQGGTRQIGARDEGSEEEEDETSSSTTTEQPNRLPSPPPLRRPLVEPTILRIQLSLSPLLHPKPTSENDTRAEFSFRILLDFPAITLRALSTPSSIRLALPSLSIPAAKEEESFVSVAASSSIESESSASSKVEILDDQVKDLVVSSLDSAISAVDGGSARWSTVRSIKDLKNQVGSMKKERVRISIDLPFTQISPTSTSQTPTPNEPTKSSQLSQPTPPRRIRPKRSHSTDRSHSNLEHLVASPSLSSLPWIKIQITPISPTLSLPSPSSASEWRIFYRLVLPPSSQISSFILPLPVNNDSKLKVHDAWGVDGRSVSWKSEYSVRVRNGSASEEEKGMRITSCASRGGFNEVLWEERKSGEEVEGAAVLPFLENRVGKYEVEVLEAQGYDLHVVIHDFDCSNQPASKLSSSSSSSGSSFTKLLVLPDTRPFLPLRFKPSWTNTPRPSTPTSKQLSPPRSRSKTLRFLLPYLPLVFFLLILPTIFLPLSPSPSQPPSRNRAIQNLDRQASIISYSTKTQTQTVVSTTTHVQTITQTHLQVPSLTPLLTTSTPTLFATPTPVQTIPVKPQDYYSISNETGNAVLVWLEQLKANAWMYWESVWKWLQSVA